MVLPRFWYFFKARTALELMHDITDRLDFSIFPGLILSITLSTTRVCCVTVDCATVCTSEHCRDNLLHFCFLQF